MAQQMNNNMAMQDLNRIMQESGVPPDVFINLGELSEITLQDRSLYPDFVRRAVEMGLMSPDSSPDEINYQVLLSLISLGRAAKQMQQSVMRMA